MAWITPTIAGISAVAGLASSAASLSRNNDQQTTNEAIQNRALADAENTQYQQQLVQALANRRAVAGQTDSFGTSLTYDPSTNQWTTTYGQQPADALRAQMQAGISRNTYDLRQAQLANATEALRATRAGGAADAAARDVSTFRPMSSSELVGLLQQQATNAQQKTFQPLVADTLRQMARSGTSAAPVLAKLGTTEAQSLRDSLIDAQIKGMQNVDTINTSRRSALQSAASDAAKLATPSFSYPSIASSGVDNTMAQVAASRAQNAATVPATTMGGVNQAQSNVSNAAKTAGESTADTNYGLNSISNALSKLSTATGKGGDVGNFLSLLTGGSDSGSSGKITTYKTDSGQEYKSSSDPDENF